MTTGRQRGTFGPDCSTSVDPPPALRDHPAAEPSAERCLDSGIDVVLVPSSPKVVADSARGVAWHYVQLWTQRRIYAVDLAMTCTAVLSRQSGKPASDQTVIGGRLTGGQLIEGENVKMVYPLPVPGTQAVFELGATGRQSFVRTSPLERVIVRLVALGAAGREKRPTWEAVAEWESLERDNRATEP